MIMRYPPAEDDDELSRLILEDRADVIRDRRIYMLS
jgi:hypothetical protein